MTDPTDLDVVLVVAVTDDGVIGKDGDLPWHYPEDLQHFRETTMGHPVVMGRRTYESLPDEYRPLPGRTNVVLSTSDPDVPDDVYVVSDLRSAWDIAADHGEEVHVIGGETVFEQTLPVADRLVLTEIHASYDGDTYFPDYDEADWREIDRDDRDELSFVEYVRVRET